MRLEHDGLGQMELPEEAYWGIVSERNRKAFVLSIKVAAGMKGMKNQLRMM